MAHRLNMKIIELLEENTGEIFETLGQENIDLLQSIKCEWI